MSKQLNFECVCKQCGAKFIHTGKVIFCVGTECRELYKEAGTKFIPDETRIARMKAVIKARNIRALIASGELEKRRRAEEQRRTHKRRGTANG